MGIAVVEIALRKSNNGKILFVLWQFFLINCIAGEIQSYMGITAVLHAVFISLDMSPLS